MQPTTMQPTSASLASATIKEQHKAKWEQPHIVKEDIENEPYVVTPSMFKNLHNDVAS